jgi:hypothetical protein
MAWQNAGKLLGLPWSPLRSRNPLVAFVRVLLDRSYQIRLSSA